MEQQKIWSHFQNCRQDTFSQADSRHRFMMRRIPTGRILNIGIGDGNFEKLAAAAGRQVHSLDPDREALARVVNLGFSKGVAGSIGNMPFGDESFDVVVCSEVLEHLGDDLLHKGLAEIHRVLKRGGELHGTVPADENLAASETVCPHCGTVFHRWGHMQSFSQERLTDLLTSSIGPSRVERRLFVHWPSLNWKGKVTSSLRFLLAAAGVWGTGHNLYFVGKKNG